MQIRSLHRRRLAAVGAGEEVGRFGWVFRVELKVPGQMAGTAAHHECTKCQSTSHPSGLDSKPMISGFFFHATFYMS